MRDKIEQALAKWGWAHTEAGDIADEEIERLDLLVHRGMMVDTIFRNDEQGRRNAHNSIPRKDRRKGSRA
jgi:hypothetical protein